MSNQADHPSKRIVGEVIVKGKNFLPEKAARRGLGIAMADFNAWLHEARTPNGVSLEVFQDIRSREFYVSEDSRNELLNRFRFMNSDEPVGPCTVKTFTSTMRVSNLRSAPNVLLLVDQVHKSFASSFNLGKREKTRLTKAVSELIGCGAGPNGLRIPFVVDSATDRGYVTEQSIRALGEYYSKRFQAR